ncbi:nicotinate-nucleotide--dimethylbenzimidazole phosphoribosyltransferase [Streptomyces pathocidini]|uniref:Nicotinate-nucleotide--dimethylbenzimidazole phosphoribosyltransferase n=1 Tax=Streptomyces pathocidini TaxID=1650571 RepID=A0ABW7UJL8_9ACTN|nr:nicotinate-nucleotide--dimethylbenzimidazole phosphoribosyltransferase [Streptomyces pathocidini]
MGERPDAIGDLEDRLAALCSAIDPPDPVHGRLSRVRQRTLARPAGSLGTLDALVHRIAAIRRDPAPGPLPAVVSVLAADHGVAARGTSLFHPEVTARVLTLVAAGRAPVNFLAERVPARVSYADFGLLSSVGDQRFRIASGTADICLQDAMTPDQARQAILNGCSYVGECLADEPLVAVGEIGVGNTTPTAALASRLLGLDPSDLVGSGSGVDAATVERKRHIVRDALTRVRAVPDDPVRLLAALGGFEIAGNVGVILAAAKRRKVVVLDGFITAVAALVAVRLCPAARGYLVAAHRSSEPGHRVLLAALDEPPLLSLDMHLGMGSGAALALGLVNAALAAAALTPSARSVGLSSPRSPVAP